MAEQWVPQAEGLHHLVELLKKSSSPVSEERQVAQQQIEQFQSIADYPCYLVYILTHGKGELETTRTVAALVLKNNARMLLKSPSPVVEYVKANVLESVRDPSSMIRTNSGTLIASLLALFEPQNWPQGLFYLVAALDSPDVGAREGAIDALDKLCQDFPRKLDVEIGGQRPLDYMIPKFIAMTSDSSPRIRQHALNAIAQFALIESQSFNANIDGFMACLFRCAGDSDPDVRRMVCTSLSILLRERSDKLVPEISNVASFMLYSMQDKDESVALEACEFWLTFAEDMDLVDALRPLLGNLVPALLQSMIYTEEDLAMLEADIDDTNVPDRDSDIRPQHYGAKSHGVGEGQSDTQPAFKSRDAGGAEEEEFEDYDYDDDDDEFVSEWNKRKCAAAALDVLAVRFGADCLATLLPLLKDRLWHQDWLIRESAVLALGAIAEGCMDPLEPHLPTILPYLCSQLQDPKPLLRSIACWSLGRYAHWCTVNIEQNQYFIPALEGLLHTVLDNNKKVQEAGCSALATLEEEAGPGLAPYLEPIVQNLVTAFSKYQHKNLLILYDAIGTLADSVGEALNRPACIEVLLPSLEQKWSALQDDDDDLIPLMECLSSVTVAAGPGFSPYAPAIFQRCLRIVHESLVRYQTFVQNPDLDEPEKSYLIVSLDLLSGLVQALGELLAPMITSSDPSFMTLLAASLQYPQPAVQQSAFALIGDLAIYCFSVLKPFLPSIMPDLISQISGEPRAEYVSVCNNAAWSIGEVAIRCGPVDPDFAQYVQPLLQSLVPILLHPKSPKSLTENAAVTIGRLGYIFPAVVAPHLDVFAEHWCQALGDIKDNAEKDSAFKGFCALILNNASGISKAFVPFCNATAKWQAPSLELNSMFQQIFSGFKSMLGENWEPQMAQVPEPTRSVIRQRYGV
ncbi:ARM repeat-containing protein [Dacryopinax primogenitus]|uniref:ARM repeat-containing protein n=1 Tax=Dacryopinax primogenitus (strain DJM 731) TaxID=1858805 RepID=M5FZL7_DACPD|nr:ARM repeat-containing protein [Dacryopinax primogenitus]EJT96947.1 ARM repeat-containing protein [Dacryopinax primogenitus]